LFPRDRSPSGRPRFGLCFSRGNAARTQIGPFLPFAEIKKTTMASKVAVIFTRPETVLDDYRRVMELASWKEHLHGDRDLLLKLNLSWTKYFPSCSSPAVAGEGVVKTLMEGGYPASKLIPIENKTVVTNPIKGAKANAWQPVLDRYGLKFQPLTQVDWKVYRFKSPLLKLNHIFRRASRFRRSIPGVTFCTCPP
jgi:hypothetical protein